ncbi:sulfotransferase family 5A, member 1 [Centroberyx affinis]|uniref:sulfotransferase family 5A, member 1 n=1 Tax=Centroberyx affinis TaxID=166261 RepID=UPI003A5C5DDB
MARLDVTETFHGITFPGHLHTQDSLQYALRFPFQDTDILIATYPKSGTTWMQEIVTLICSKGDPQLSQTVPNWTRAPWLEQYYSAAVLEASSRGPRVITTHLPQHLLGPALQGSKAKVIYVSRNPKDVIVSYYHFHKMAKFLPEPGSFQDFLNRFLEGTSQYGSWFDHVKDWTSQTATMNNLLHITYEEMSLDLGSAIERVSTFLQCPLLEEEVGNCLKHCSFSNMRDNRMVNYTLIPEEIMDHNRGSFMRKGKIGDWKNMFTDEQNHFFESVFRSRMQDCSLKFVWERQDEEELCAIEGIPLKTAEAPVIQSA